MLHNPMTAPTGNLRDILVSEQITVSMAATHKLGIFEIELDTQRARVLGPRQSGCGRLRLRWKGRLEVSVVGSLVCQAPRRAGTPREGVAARAAASSIAAID